MQGDLVARIGRLDTAAVSDALDSLGIPGRLARITARTGHQRIAGPAFTVRYRPAPTGGSEFHGAADYIDTVPAGAVIVIDNNGSLECTNWGNILTYKAMAAGIAGTVVHGSARDIDEIVRMGYPVFSTGVTMVSGKNRVVLDETRCPIRIGDILVEPDDIILADANGALRIPRAIAREVVERAEAVESTEQKILDAVRAGGRLDDARKQFDYTRPWGAEK
ncbi:RraA family protein [Nocardia terpenica]|uniref:Putative 4-hydroxy-4-methyl-2-oxoglutarate aldolase n=1 Tax=Nocardia terpenica TaxID=455432 RepID=A0A291RS14_9NOCA|nr:S-adenosylmethionine--2-demethylmenaquinone methyltransferase [Nocardia terpenica]ATL70024.1 S-adenosylmethionine--2-demethylmenaquinone methyltransferase [Nocardia terpenica]